MTEGRYNPVARLAEMALDDNPGPGRYGSRDAYVGKVLELTRLGCAYTEVEPGKSACPYHVHHAEDELFVILAGEGEYRFGGAVHQVRPGDVLGAPIGGAEYAHQLTNTGSEMLRYLVVSSKADIDVCEYPDSGKFAVYSDPVAGTPRNKFVYVGREETRLDYFDGDDVGETP